MQGLSKQRALEELRARIDSIEKRPTLGEARPSLGKASLIAPPAGVLHEVFSDEQRDAGASLGFTLGLARPLLSTERLILFILQLRHEGQAIGVPYAMGLKSFGIDPENIVFGFVETPLDLFWAIEEALACRAVAAVIADIGTPLKSLDFTVSRRLSLRAAVAGSSAFLLRYGRDREASAARFRWHVEPVPSPPMAFDPRAPNGARWHVGLEKGRLRSRREPVDWVVDWTSNGFRLADSQNAVRPGPAPGPALPRALPAPLGNRLSQAG